MQGKTIYPLVQILVRENRIKSTVLAEKVGMSRDRLAAKLAGKEDLTLKEATRIRNALTDVFDVETLFNTNVFKRVEADTEKLLC